MANDLRQVELFVDHLLNRSILIVEQTLYLQRAQVCNIVRGNTVMIEEEPLALVLYDRVMGCPAYNRIQDHALISERSVSMWLSPVEYEK